MIASSLTEATRWQCSSRPYLGDRGCSRAGPTLWRTRGEVRDRTALPCGARQRLGEGVFSYSLDRGRKEVTVSVFSGPEVKVRLCYRHLFVCDDLPSPVTARLSYGNSSHVECPSEAETEWSVEVDPEFLRIHLHITTTIPASFSAVLCSPEREGATCDPQLPVHTITRVWRSDSRYFGKRLICPEYAYSRLGLVATAMLIVAVSTAMVVFFGYRFTRRVLSAPLRATVMVCVVTPPSTVQWLRVTLTSNSTAPGPVGTVQLDSVPVPVGSEVRLRALSQYQGRSLELIHRVPSTLGGGHVLLLYPSEESVSLPVLVSSLGSSLAELGFSVSLDLWSRTQLCSLGPVPWLHSRLAQLQQDGGKAVLILTQGAWEQAERWVQHPGSRTRQIQNSSEPRLDVFSASLSCILADFLQGRAGERFVLAQFETPLLPVLKHEGLPEIFKGIPLYSLPTQSLAFLTELSAVPRKSGTSRGRRADSLRAASKEFTGRLARRLKEVERGAQQKSGDWVSWEEECRRSRYSTDSGVGGTEDMWESVPLQPNEARPQGRETSLAHWV
ncbi:UNVERIFIED_CONTAM: hypothetical protein FKN15_025817 [Acipenser sinensis]